MGTRVHEYGAGSARGLERQADRLLRGSLREMGRGEYWFYTQRWMEMLSAREQGGVEELPGPPMLGHENSLALLAWLVVGANLTRRQRQVIRLLASGMRQCEIAMHLGISQTQVSRLKHAALRNMRRLASDMRDVRDGKPG